jgi:putative tryptophan/tyrosine transport system substrate-binding protein
MTRAVRLVVVVALAAALLAAVVAGCGSSGGSSSSSSSSASPSAAADAKTKAYTIGISQIVTHPALDATVNGIKDELTAEGFTNITYDLQNAEGDMSTAASIAQKFAGENLAMAIGVATPTSQALAKAITTTPVLFTAVTDPVGAGLVTDPAAPSGNVTGVSDMQPVKPILDLVKTFRPDAKAVGMVYNAGEANSVFLVKQAEKDAATMGLTIVKAPASTSAEVQQAAQSLVGRAQAIMVIGDNTAVSALESIIKVAQQNKMPLLAGDPDSVKRGAVASYGFDYYDLGKQTGAMAAKVLSGTPVAQLPVVFMQDLPENLQLSINEKAAAAQGVTIPQDLVDKAANKY